MMRTTVFSLLLAIGVVSSSLAQSVEFSGQIRERSEFDDKSFIEAQHHDVFHLLRTRLQATATVNDRVKVVVEIQDSRVFGQQAGTLNHGAPAFDLSQGYVLVNGLADGHLSFALGRQALVYANERLLGAIDWNNFRQSFDAGVLRLATNDMSLDAFGAAIHRHPVITDYARDVFLAGLWGAWSPQDKRNTLQAYWLFDTPQDAISRQNRHSTGIYAGGHYGMLDYEIDAAMQFGDYVISGSDSRTISANLVGLRLAYNFPDLMGLRVGLGYDRLSGSDPDKTDTYGIFNTLYGTSHKFYGYMDYFSNIPFSTSGLGLQDVFAQARISPSPTFHLGLDIHLFSTTIDPGKLLPERTPEWSSFIGMEIDVTAGWKMADAVNMTAGVSMFNADKNRAVLLPGATESLSETSTWAFIMTTVNF